MQEKSLAKDAVNFSDAQSRTKSDRYDKAKIKGVTAPKQVGAFSEHE